MFPQQSFLFIYGIVLVKIICLVQGQIPLNRVGFLETLGDKQYFIENTAKVNWYKAIQFCNSLNMTLASIESQTEQKNLKTFLLLNSALNDQYWLSGNDLSLSGEFIWHGTGKRMSYSSWAVNPGINKLRRCIYTNNSFNWLRDSCITPHYFICERPLVSECGLMDSCNLRPLIIY